LRGRAVELALVVLAVRQLAAVATGVAAQPVLAAVPAALH
jgi:hypothetical protein